jgi:hypothetical protein
MRTFVSILTVSLLSTTVVAQTTYQRWDMHPNRTSFTSRGNIGSGWGAIYQGVHASTNRGVLDVGGKCHISRFHTISQDQNCQTKETFGFCVRIGSDASGPSPTVAGLIGLVAGLRTPNNGSAACAFAITTTLARPIAVPSTQHWSFGINLDPAPTWTMDGLSTHAARGAPTTTPLHNSHARQADQAWQIIGPATVATHPSQRRSWRYGVDVADGAVLNLQCNGKPGYGGSYPEASTASAPFAWSARVEGGPRSAGANTAIVIGTGRIAGVSFGIAADLYLLGPYAIFPGPIANATGLAIIPLLPFVPASASGAGVFHLQAVLGNSRGLKLTNAQSVIP